MQNKTPLFQFCILCLLIVTLQCKNTNYYQDIYHNSVVITLDAIKIDSLNKIVLEQIDNQSIAKELIKITDDFYNTISSIVSNLIGAAKGFKFDKEIEIATDLFGPSEKRPVKQIMIEEKSDKLITELVLNHQKRIKQLLSQKQNLQGFNLDEKYSQIKQHSISFEGLTVAESLLVLSNLIKSEKELIQDLIEKIK